MKMKVQIIGKAHREGTSKAGKSYNFNEVHYVGKAYGVEGDAALTANLDGLTYPYASILVGQTYNLEFDILDYPLLANQIQKFNLIFVTSDFVISNRGYVLDFSQVR